MSENFNKSIIEMDHIFWERIRKIKFLVQKSVEIYRDRKIIGSSLQAEIDIYTNTRNLMLLNRLEDELRYFFIVSRVGIHPDYNVPENAMETEDKDLFIMVSASEHPKCERCFHYQRDVNLDKKYPNICYRCIDAINGISENRKYV